MTDQLDPASERRLADLAENAPKEGRELARQARKARKRLKLIYELAADEAGKITVTVTNQHIRH